MSSVEMTNGLYVKRWINPQLKTEFQNNRMGFLSTLGTVPKDAVTKSGIVIEELIENTQVALNRTTPFTDEEVTKLLFKHGIKKWDFVTTFPQETDLEEMKRAKHVSNKTIRTRHTAARLRYVRDKVIRGIAPDDIADTEIIVVDATGEPRKNGLTTVCEADVNALGEELRAVSMPEDGSWHLTLNNYHLTDLKNEKKNAQVFKNNYYNPKKSSDIESLAGFNIGWDLALPNYKSDGSVKPQGTVLDIDDGDQVISLFHHTGNTFYHPDKAFATATDIETDTRNNPPKAEYRELSYFCAGTIWKKYLGVIVSKKA